MSDAPTLWPFDEGPGGGTYDVFYWTVNQAGRVTKSPDFDRDTTDQRARALKLDPGEIAMAVCKNQPGGFMVYGSDRARLAFRQHLDALAKGENAARKPAP